MVGQLAAEPTRPFLCLTPCSWDKLIFINLPRSLEPRVSMMLESGWGTQDTKTLEKTKHGCSLRIKMIGNPWTGETGSAGVQVSETLRKLKFKLKNFHQIRQLLLDLVKMLQTQNFQFVANINFRGAADSLFFESHQSGGGGPGASVFSLARPEEMFAISLNRTDRLRLISANSDVQHNVGALGTLKIMI